MKHLRNTLFLAWLAVLSFSCLPSSRATNFVVAIGNFFYRPTNLVINVSDSVLWTNVSGTMHDVTQGLTTTPTNSRLWISPQFNTPQTYSFTFSNAGFYPYICKLHTVDSATLRPEQTGTVSVITGNLPPLVHITSPANAAQFVNAASVTINANAADTNGAVSQVDFYTRSLIGNQTAFIGTDTTSPYTIVASNLFLGSNFLTAVVTDNLGLSVTSAPININITNRALTNIVIIQSLAFSPQVTVVAAGGLVIWTNRDAFAHTATGDAGSFEPLCGPSVNLVTAFNCTNRFMTPGVYPYFCSIHPTMRGTVVVVKAVSTPIASLTKPSPGAGFVANSPIVFEAAASDSDGIAGVEFFRNGNVSLGTDASAPYSISNSLPVGSYTAYAKVTDTLGFGAFTPQVPFSVAVPADLRLVSPQINGGLMEFDLTTAAGLSYTVERSSGLNGGWLSLTSNIATGTVLRVIDPTPSLNAPQRFYRAFIAP